MRALFGRQLARQLGLDGGVKIAMFTRLSHVRHPCPFRRKTWPFWVPGGNLEPHGLPPRFGTSASPPSTAVVTGTRTFAWKSWPLRSKRESGVR